MTAYTYTDANGTERVMRARTREHASNTVRAIERERSGSIAAGEIAAATLAPLTPKETNEQ